jgi:SAM-dependent methyltransferase
MAENTFYYPDYVARFYDVIYHTIRDEVDTDYFLKKIAGYNGKVLEVGVGTGRLFLSALNKGADIYGIDISPAMIDVLKKQLNPGQQQRVRVDDMVTMQLDQKFDLIVAPFRVFSHIMSVDEQLRALNNISRHLQADGTFIFDLYVPSHAMLASGLDHVTDFEGDYEPGKKLRRITSMQADPIEQISYVTMRYIWEEENGREVEKVWNLQMRYYFRYELEHLIALSDLKIKHFFGNYQEQALNKDSKDFVVVCERR